MANCMYCNAEIAEGSTFCAQCGKKQVKIYTQTFQRKNRSEAQFIDEINQWFAKYPHVANVKGKFQTHHGIGLMVNKYVLDAFTIEYEVYNRPNENQYSITLLTSTNLVKTSTDSLLAQWQKENPGAQVLSRTGGVNQRGHTGSLLLGGVGAVNKTQLYVFYKYKRASGPSVPQP